MVAFATLFLAATSGRLEASNWALDFTLPFSSQIVSNVNGTAFDPQPYGAALREVAGLNPGDLLVIDASDGNRYRARVDHINPQTHWVDWTLVTPMPPNVTAALNGFVGSSFSALDDAGGVYTAPQQSAVDQSGRIYSIDTGKHRVVVFDRTGTALWTLGGLGRVYSNEFIGADPDSGGGPCPACSNDPSQERGGFVDPSGIDVSPDGRTIVVGDSSNHRVQVFHQNDTTGAVAGTDVSVAAPHFDVFTIGGFGSGSAAAAPQFVYPMGVGLFPSTTDAWGISRIAVADAGNNRVQVFTITTGTGFTAVDTAGGAHKFSSVVFGLLQSPNNYNLVEPRDVKFDRSPGTDGRLAVADTGNNNVEVFSPAGVLLYALQPDALGSSEPADFALPSGVGFDDSGRLFVADSANNRIQVFSKNVGGHPYGLKDPASDVFGVAQSPLGDPTEIQFLTPSGVAATGGHVYVTEGEGYDVKVLTGADISIDSPLILHPPDAVTIGDPDHDTVDVTVRVRNVGSVRLSNVTVAATGPSILSAPAMDPAATDLMAGETVDVHFRIQITAYSESSLHLNLVATGYAGTGAGLQVQFELDNVDTGVLINPSSAAGIGVGVVTAPPKVGVSDQILVTVPVQNVGGTPLSNVTVKVTPLGDGSNVTLSQSPTAFDLAVTSTPHFVDVPVSFSAVADGTVQFDVTVTADVVDADGTVHHAAVVKALPNAARVTIVRDHIAPSLLVSEAPRPNLPNPTTAGKPWFNGSTVPCSADSCEPAAVPTWQTLTVTATDNTDGSGVAELHWRIIDTNSGTPTAPIGSCLAATADHGTTPENLCTVAADGSLQWSRTLSGTQGRIIIAFWAADKDGNGAASTAEEDACKASPVLPGQTTKGNVLCYTLYIDIDPPVLMQGAITLADDNSAAHIAFVGFDPISGINKMTADKPLETDAAGNGILTLTGEGESVSAQVTLTDFARNRATISLPVNLAGRPSVTIRLDHTPPEAFNRLDPTALGKRCTTSIGGQPVSYFCTNKVYGTDNLSGFPATPFAPTAVLPTRWGGDFDDGHADDWNIHGWGRRINWDNDGDDHDWDGGSAELHTYRFSDAVAPEAGTVVVQQPNQITLVEKVRQSGNEARIHVISYQYSQGKVTGPVIKPDWAFKKYQWSTNADGSLKSLVQKFEVRDGWHRAMVIATFDARRNTTRIIANGRHVESHDHDRRHSRDDDDDDRAVSGLILLRMTTAAGGLEIEYDVDSPISAPDIAPPVLTVPSALRVEATRADGAAVTFAASATDAVGPAVIVPVCTATSGATFPLGTTAVNCSATDAAGNLAQRSFTVTVRDTTAPAITVPLDITVQAAGPHGALVGFAPMPYATDLVDQSVGLFCSATSGTTFPLGTTAVSCIALDNSGNKSTASFKVTVSDTTAPVLTLPAPITVTTTSSSGANVTFAATAVDSVSGTRSVQCTASSGSKFRVGTTLVTCSASDAAGNTASGSFSVTVNKN